MAKDMTSGKPLKLLLLFTVPLLIGNIFQQFYSMVDTIVVGRYVGPFALAAVGSTGALSFLVIGFATGLMGGFSIIISQQYGALNQSEQKNYDTLKHAVAMSFALTAVITVLITVAMIFFTRPLLEIMKTPEDIIDDAYTYIFIVFMGVVFTLYYNLVSAIMRAVGDSKTPLYLLIIASVVNVALDLVFVILFDMGIAGVAYATIIAQGLSAVIGIWYLFSHYRYLIPQKKHWIPTRHMCWELLRLGGPNAFMTSITAIGCMIMQAVVNSFGSIVVAGFTAAGKVEMLACEPCSCLGVAMATYVGQNYGAKRLDRVKEGVHKGLIITVSFNIAVAIAVLIFGRALAGIFVDNSDALLFEQIVSSALVYQNAVAITAPFLGVLFLYRNALQGLGNPTYPFMSGVLELICRTVIPFWWAGMWGYAGVCWATPFAWITAAILLGVGFYLHYYKLKNRELSHA